MTKRQEWQQIILFIGFYVLLDFGYFQIPVDLFINVIYYYGVVTICADVINFIAPLENVVAQQNHLISVNANLEIVRGCDGAGVLFLVISAILAFPAKLIRKLIGLMLGIILISMINLIRIIVLYFVVAYHSEWFSLIHTYLAPTLMVIVGGSYFAWWAFGSLNKTYEPA